MEGLFWKVRDVGEVRCWEDGAEGNIAGPLGGRRRDVVLPDSRPDAVGTEHKIGRGRGAVGKFQKQLADFFIPDGRLESLGQMDAGWVDMFQKRLL